MKVQPSDLELADAFALLSACLAPRPVALVSTVSAIGVVNLAPFSNVVPIAARPALLGVVIHPRNGKPKDTLRNILDRGAFVINAVPPDLAGAAVEASADLPPDASEADRTGLAVVPGDRVAAPRLADSPVALECRLSEIMNPRGCAGALVVGEVVLVHVADALVEGVVPSPDRFRPIGHLGMASGAHVFCTMGPLLRIPPPR